MDIAPTYPIEITRVPTHQHDSWDEPPRISAFFSPLIIEIHTCQVEIESSADVGAIPALRNFRHGMGYSGLSQKEPAGQLRVDWDYTHIYEAYNMDAT